MEQLALQVGQLNDINKLKSENESHVFQLGEQDVEMERMRTTIYALNQKLLFTEELKETLGQQQENLDKSEAIKEELQESYDLSVKKIEESIERHIQRQQEQVEQIYQLEDSLLEATREKDEFKVAQIAELDEAKKQLFSQLQVKDLENQKLKI